LSQLGLNLGYLLVQIICFLIIFLVVNAWVVKPLKGLLEKRRQKIAQGLEDARVAAEARASAEQDAAKVLADAQAKSMQIINEATERADKAALEVKASADKDLEKERKAILAGAEQERNRILGELRGEVAALAIAAAQKLIGEALDEKRQHALLEEFFSGVRSGKTVVLEGAELVGESAEVISALPLTRDEQESVRQDILFKMGKQAEVNFNVDPSILGGLIVKVGDKVLDGSVAGQLEGLRQTLK
jgi:F-type H+-transporting ATPase subunit b